MAAKANAVSELFEIAFEICVRAWVFAQNSSLIHFQLIH
jgi:hypothetical protein